MLKVYHWLLWEWTFCMYLYSVLHQSIWPGTSFFVFCLQPLTFDWEKKPGLFLWTPALVGNGSIFFKSSLLLKMACCRAFSVSLGPLLLAVSGYQFMLLRILFSWILFLVAWRNWFCTLLCCSGFASDPSTDNSKASIAAIDIHTNTLVVDSGMFADASEIFWRASKIFWNCNPPPSPALPICDYEKYTNLFQI